MTLTARRCLEHDCPLRCRPGRYRCPVHDTRQTQAVHPITPADPDSTVSGDSGGPTPRPVSPVQFSHPEPQERTTE